MRPDVYAVDDGAGIAEGDDPAGPVRLLGGEDDVASGLVGVKSLIAEFAEAIAGIAAVAKAPPGNQQGPRGYRAATEAPMTTP